MLTPEQVHEALTAADKEAAVCGKVCRIGSKVEEQTFACWHNGTGSSDTSHQTVYAPAVLAMAVATLTALLVKWLQELHAHRAYNLNGDT